jgi:hypothetical protein
MRRTDYLFQRPGSRNWHIKLQSPTGRIEKSLRTSDRVQAEILALPMIAEHKAKLLAARPHLQTVRKLEPGEHAGPEGGKIVANERELIYLNHNGAYLRTEPNAAQMVVPPYPESSAPAVVKFLRSLDHEPRPTVTAKTGDDAVFQTYIDSGARKGRGLDGYARKEAQAVWELFRTLTNGKPLKECTRDDGRLLVAHYTAEGLSYPSMQKKIMWLSAMIEFSIAERKLSMLNPFSGRLLWICAHNVRINQGVKLA